MGLIVVTRGDTKGLKFKRTRDGQVITQEADKVYFTVKNNTKEKKALFQKTIDDMEFGEDYYYHFILLPEDTDNLEYEDYVYDIEVMVGDTYKNTISKGIFSVTDETTHKCNEV